MPVEPPDYATLTAMISPALFLTATGSLIISTSNRMSRIVDRIRILTEFADEIDRGESALDFPERRQQFADELLERLADRSRRVRSALSLLYASLAAFVGTSLALAVDVLFGHPFESIPTMLAVAGVILLFLASLQLVREARLALGSNHSEIEFHRELRAWRRRRREGPRLPGGAG
jgi:hypothetical protein